MISTRKAKHPDATTMFTYSHANTPLGQSERTYYLSYFINNIIFSLFQFQNYFIKYLSLLHVCISKSKFINAIELIYK